MSKMTPDEHAKRVVEMTQEQRESLALDTLRKEMDRNVGFFRTGPLQVRVFCPRPENRLETEHTTVNREQLSGVFDALNLSAAYKRDVFAILNKCSQLPTPPNALVFLIHQMLFTRALVISDIDDDGKHKGRAVSSTGNHFIVESGKSVLRIVRKHRARKNK